MLVMDGQLVQVILNRSEMLGFCWQDFCYKLKYKLTEEEKAALMIRTNSLTQQLEVDCFMDQLQLYMQVSTSAATPNRLKRKGIYNYTSVL
jgi:hypothetical protein